MSFILVIEKRFCLSCLGVVYIKYSKASEAALALEEMNMKTLPGHPKPLKVRTHPSPLKVRTHPVTQNLSRYEPTWSL